KPLLAGLASAAARAIQALCSRDAGSQTLEADATENASTDGLTTKRGDGGATSATVRSLVQCLAAAGCFQEASLARDVHAQLQAVLIQLSAGMDGSTMALPPLAVTDVVSPAKPAILATQRHLSVLWKPPGWTVTVGWGCDEEWSPADQGAEGVEEREEKKEGELQPLQGWVVERLGSVYPIATDASAQHGLVHRLDKDTSGLMLCALSYHGYHLAHLEFVSGRVTKEYVLLCHGHLADAPRRIEVPLRVVGDKGARRSAPGLGARPACTEVRAVAHLVGKSLEGGEKQQDYSLVEVKLHSGRLHQIRAHLSLEGHPLLGDRDYGAPPATSSKRPFLHAHHLRVDLGEAEGPLDAHCALPADLASLLGSFSASDAESGVMLEKWRRGTPV
ncbi:unnamed protein product, partial [Polarella glacialis]